MRYFIAIVFIGTLAAPTGDALAAKTKGATASKSHATAHVKASHARKNRKADDGWTIHPLVGSGDY
ncbi:MAG: hypothetical protein KGM42_08905 [Hyphomicrobiales bacterium]|nr:hypothetical protein [Hyphomicrobiales bacterium]